MEIRLPIRKQERVGPSNLACQRPTMDRSRRILFRALADERGRGSPPCKPFKERRGTGFSNWVVPERDRRWHVNVLRR